MSYNSATASRERAFLDARSAALVIAAVSAIALSAAWAFELAGIEPCQLCLEERVPYYAGLPGGILAAWLAMRAPKLAATILAALVLGFLYNAGLSVYHAGAEWKFWPGPDSCAGGDGTLKTGSLIKALQNNNAVRCDEAAIRIWGISLAGYNVLISAALAAVAGFGIWRSR
ncbi:disulfide bond formation protein B [Rhodomicrobium sp. Az07]|uniref:disulfide bond formation protein B n=1 Tax=Rhodomicrobium sp. Az07 TaxID=2839034 RepID=UPI001BE5B521|nr:disulfide bond formation protein B [Rhodomicrobium sp. Az07]MBT3070182.1 disulfide bond formation protein B [Rhodomicrobium sp. Az07]